MWSVWFVVFFFFCFGGAIATKKKALTNGGRWWGFGRWKRVIIRLVEYVYIISVLRDDVCDCMILGYIGP